MIDLATKQAFWCEQLPNFEAKYWLPSHFEFLIFDKDQGNYVIKEDLDPSFEDEATEIFHRVNTGWAMWKKAINFNDQQAEIDSLKAEKHGAEIGHEHFVKQLKERHSQEIEQLKAENAALKERLQKIEDGEFVVVPKMELMTVIGNCSDAMSDETTSSVFDKTGEPSTWYDHHIIAENKILSMIEAAQGDGDE